MHTKLQYFCSTFVPDKVKYGYFCYIWYLTEKWQNLAGTTGVNKVLFFSDGLIENSFSA